MNFYKDCLGGGPYPANGWRIPNDGCANAAAYERQHPSQFADER
jgi:hypothetical protein